MDGACICDCKNRLARPALVEEILRCNPKRSPSGENRRDTIRDGRHHGQQPMQRYTPTAWGVSQKMDQVFSRAPISAKHATSAWRAARRPSLPCIPPENMTRTRRAHVFAKRWPRARGVFQTLLRHSRRWTARQSSHFDRWKAKRLGRILMRGHRTQARERTWLDNVVAKSASGDTLPRRCHRNAAYLLHGAGLRRITACRTSRPPLAAPISIHGSNRRLLKASHGT